MHPTVIDFWLIGVYTELDIKGNLFSSRKLMLQAIRINDTNLQVYVEFFKYEVKFFEKMKQRRMILNGDSEKKIDFIENEEDEKMEVIEEAKISDQPKLVQIVFDNLKDKFPSNLKVF